MWCSFFFCSCGRGAGETFLFSLNRDNVSCYRWVGSDCPEAGSVSAAPGSEAEKIRDAASFFVYCGRSELAVGGGRAGYGLWLNGDLTEATSTRCATFDNAPLGGPGTDGVDQQVHVIELWAFT
ncbi:MAG: hypothetical protein BJ554DRAFT_1161 [Olpidium bornovanus]|uniref:TLDc domain-containing protein n=1 Tax=Olpidium bornovanus TaxID=278681 RepID=A0A8H8DI04_9FUNG|nr:MAG: hypothetical protein BJ554DRAFT_1161 [Olpidium bornovanus]